MHVITLMFTNKPLCFISHMFQFLLTIFLLTWYMCENKMFYEIISATPEKYFEKIIYVVERRSLYLFVPVLRFC